MYFNNNIEYAILGKLIMDDRYVDLILEEVEEKYFYFDYNKRVFSFLQKEIKEKGKINQITIKNHLKTITETEDYLGLLIMQSSTIIDIKPYILELKNLYAKRKLQEIIEISQKSLEEENNAKDILDKVNDELEKLEEVSNRYKYEVYNVNEILSKRIIEIEQSRNSEQNNYIKTDIIDFDRAFTGIPRSQLTIIGGRSSMGKSTFALQIALNVAKTKNVLFFSEEMGLRENADKILANLTRINSIKVRDSNVTNEELNAIKNACTIKENNNLYIVEKQGINSDYILRTIKRFERKVGKVDLIIVDHLQMTNDSQKSRNRIEELGNITLDFKNIAKQYDCGFILLSQLSRGVEGRDSPRPELIDLRESGRIEENADLIMFVYRKEYYIERDIQGMEDGEKKEKLKQELEKYKNQADIMVKKYRNGKCGSITLRFIPEYSLFSDLAGQNIYN